MNERMINDYLDEFHGIISKLKMSKDKILEVAKIIKESGAIYIAGNGGSSATASHFANDLQNMCSKRAFCLTDNISLITSYANDDGYEWIFDYQLQDLASKNDTLIVISGSGDSQNIYNAVLEAIWKEMNIIAFVGMDGGKLMEKFTEGINYIHIESDMQHSEDWHLMICHLICKLIEREK